MPWSGLVTTVIELLGFSCSECKSDWDWALFHSAGGIRVSLFSSETFTLRDWCHFMPAKSSITLSDILSAFFWITRYSFIHYSCATKPKKPPYFPRAALFSTLQAKVHLVTFLWTDHNGIFVFSLFCGKTCALKKREINAGGKIAQIWMSVFKHLNGPWNRTWQRCGLWVISFCKQRYVWDTVRKATYTLLWT